MRLSNLDKLVLTFAGFTVAYVATLFTVAYIVARAAS